MSVRVIVPPTPVVTIEDVGRHIVDLPPEDKVYVESLVLAATAWIDGPAGWLGRSLGVQRLEMSGWFGHERCIHLPFGPIIGNPAVVTEDENGTETPVLASSSTYRLSRDKLIVAEGARWICEPVQHIRYDAGYNGISVEEGGTGDVPPPIKVAILMIVAQWYRTREPVAIGATVEQLPFAVEALLGPYRVYL